jgi:hypothetical protein
MSRGPSSSDVQQTEAQPTCTCPPKNIPNPTSHSCHKGIAPIAHTAFQPRRTPAVVVRHIAVKALHHPTGAPLRSPSRARAAGPSPTHFSTTTPPDLKTHTTHNAATMTQHEAVHLHSPTQHAERPKSAPHQPADPPLTIRPSNRSQAFSRTHIAPRPRFHLHPRARLWLRSALPSDQTSVASFRRRRLSLRIR